MYSMFFWLHCFTAALPLTTNDQTGVTAIRQEFYWKRNIKHLKSQAGKKCINQTEILISKGAQ